jgi:predicted metal-dependent phosphoesterase TrpH
MPMAVDLHTHTTYSDGTLTPQQLVNHACERKLTALAVTDHDITKGNEEAMFYGNKYGLKVVPGVELSIDCTLPNKGHMHILGLLIDFRDDKLNRALNFLRAEREKRNHKIAAILAAMNITISVAEIEQEAGEGSGGRPHIARLLVQKGYVTSMQEAFERFLKKGAPAYVEKVKLDEQQGIELIHDADGLSILAHPSTLGYDEKQQLADKILHLRNLGLDGIEVYSSFHNQELSRWLEEFAQQNDMAISGGSDFHGANKQGIQIGIGKGNLNIPDRIYQQLQTYKNHKKEKNGD